MNQLWRRLFPSRILMAVLVISLMNACSAISKEHYFAPKLDAYKDTGYIPTAEKVSGYEPSPAPIVQLSGGRQRLVLTSQEHRIELEVRNILSERLLFVGPCIIIPLPVIPVMFYNDVHEAEAVLLKGSIATLKGGTFSLNSISAAINAQAFSRIEITESRIEYLNTAGGHSASQPQSTEEVQQVVKFGAKVPVRLQELETLDVRLQVLDSKGQELFVPPVHFARDEGVKWLVCLM